MLCSLTAILQQFPSFRKFINSYLNTVYVVRLRLKHRIYCILVYQVNVKQMRKTAKCMALMTNVLGPIPSCLEALWMMAAEMACLPGQHNRNNGTNRFFRTGGNSS